MDIIFMSFRKVILLSLSNYYTRNNIKSHTISAQSWNEEFELPYESYSVSYIQEYFEYITNNFKKERRR